MSAETLRRAAALMRERAEAAIDREASADWFTSSVLIADGFEPEDARLMASWHPAVALAVADLLTRLADRAADIADTIGSSRVADDVVTNNLLGYREALAVARTYLGEKP